MLSDRIFGVDRYELTARLRPAFFALLPIIAVGLVWIPAAWTVWGGIVGLLVTCGVTVMFSRLARYRGRRIEEKYKDRLGRAVSMMALRHRDELIDPATKRRYHEALRRAGHDVPTTAFEATTPDHADDLYRGCVSWLLEKTRDTKAFPLILEENIDYGFRRNALSLKPVAVPIALLCAVVNGGIAYANWPAGDATAWKPLAVALTCLVALAVWVFIVRLAFVEDAARSFAIRLLAACDQISKTTTREPTGRSTGPAAKRTRRVITAE